MHRYQQASTAQCSASECSYLLHDYCEFGALRGLQECCATLKARNLGILFGVLLALNFPSCLVSMLTQMQGGRTSYRNAKALSAIFCNNTVFSWKSCLSSVLAVSSAKAELNALCACAANVAYCLANELGFLQLR